MKGITFGSYHSYDDFNLILNNKEIASPAPKIEKINIPGADGELDFTEFFGEVKYKNRKLTFNFTLLDTPSNFLTAFSEIQKSIHGKKFRITLDDDPNFYYVGRCTVDKWNSDKNIGKITIEADCEPYKFKQENTIVHIASGQQSTTLSNLQKSVVPKIHVGSKNIFDIEGWLNTWNIHYKLQSGVYSMTSFGQAYSRPITLFDEDTLVTLSGNYSDLPNSRARFEFLNAAGDVIITSRDSTRYTGKISKVRINFISNVAHNFQIENAQLEFGETSTEYEAYDEAVETSISSNGISATLSAGNHIVPELMLKEGNTIWSTSGDAHLHVSYQEGEL